MNFFILSIRKDFQNRVQRHFYHCAIYLWLCAPDSTMSEEQSNTEYNIILPQTFSKFNGDFLSRNYPYTKLSGIISLLIKHKGLKCTL